jgi:hypothetical protein
MLFLRIFQHLLPTGEAWRITIDKALRRLFAGLAPAGDDAKEFIDLVYLDRFPGTTRAIAEWERELGLNPAVTATEAARRQALAAEKAATGGQSPAYIQGVLQTAGFDVYVHEWWEPPGGTPWVERDPRDYTDDPLGGTVQCGEDFAECGDDDAQCDDFLVNDPHYFANLNLTNQAPPPIPDDPAKWRGFLYIGGELFGTSAEILPSRKAEFQRLIQKLKPAQNWIVTLVQYEAFEVLLTEDGDSLTTEDGDFLVS